MGIVVKQFAVPLFALPQQLFRTLTLGDVADDVGKSTHFASAVNQRS